MFSPLASALLALAFQPAPVTAPVLAPPIMRTRQFSAAERAALAQRGRTADACRRAFVGQDYWPQPAIWRIADADTKIYLLGTVHILTRGFEWRTAQLDAIVAEAGQLITENGNAGVGSSLRTAIEATAPRAGDGGLVPIADRLGGEQRIKWLGMRAMLTDERAAQLDRQPSWMAAFAISGLPPQMRTPPVIPGVDHQLEQEFRKAGKPVTAMEENRAVIASMATIPETEQRRWLAATLDRVGRPVSLQDKLRLHHLWARGEDVSNSAGGEDPSGILVTPFARERLLYRRNAAWVDVVRQRLGQPGTVLAAVGAAHLWGDGSLIDLLAKQGIVATRVSPTTPARPRARFAPQPAQWRECDAYMFGKAAVARGD